MAYYVDSIRQLIESDSQESYGQQLLAFTTKWSQPFTTYFLDRIHAKIDRIGSWQQRPLNVEMVTSNQSESFNAQLKRLQNWQEAPVDAMALVLFRLSEFDVYEISRGRAGQGNYILRRGLVPLQDYPTAPVVPVEDIVDRIRNGVPTQASTSSTSSAASASTHASASASPSTSSAASPSSPSSGHSLQPDDRDDVEPQDQNAEPDDTNDAEPQDPNAQHIEAMKTTHERAASIIATGKISLDSKLAIFTVVGTKEPRVVRLFPTTTCSCPAQSSCYHVTAARMAIGIYEVPKKRNFSLTQLNKNVRKKPDKTSGRKRPRLQDVDVQGAGDADPSTIARVAAAVAVPPTASTVNVTEPPDTVSQSTASAASYTPVASRDDCQLCKSAEPPADKIGRAKTVAWIQCDQCALWFHNVCAGVRGGKRKKFDCPDCLWWDTVNLYLSSCVLLCSLCLYNYNLVT